MTIYPNPSNGKFHIDFRDFTNLTNFSITNNDGKIIKQVDCITHKTVSVDLSSLERGLYTIQVEYQGRILTKRIMIKQRG